MLKKVNYFGFTFRKIHSLLGIVPLGIFLVEHLIANSTVIFGEAAFGQTVDFLESIPGLWILELMFIALPLLFHGVMGLIMVFQASNNPQSYPYLRNWMFYFQRISGLIIFAFLIYHLYTVKFSSATNISFYQIINQQLSNFMILTFYIISLIAASFHFCNGIWGFAINWGILTGFKAQRLFSAITICFFLVFNYFWLKVMFGFI